jgi:DNA-binding transcriptional LysR family regulator
MMSSAAAFLNVLPGALRVAGAGLVRLRLTHPTLDRRILLVWQPATSPPAARAFLALARDRLTPPADST